LNKKYYNYFNYYIKTLESFELSTKTSLSKSEEMVNRKLIKQMLEYIDDYFIIFCDVFNRDDEINVQQDMYCIHSSTLGYGMYLEKRIQKFTKSIINLEDVKVKEVSRYYDDEVLKLAEKFENLKNEVLVGKEHMNNYTKRSKEELDIHITNSKIKLSEDVKKNIHESYNKNNQEYMNNYNNYHKKVITESERVINTLTSESINKIRNEVMNILDQKIGALSEINNVKAESINEIIEYSSTYNDRLLDLINKETFKLNELELETRRLLKVDIESIIKGLEFEVVKSIKTQAKSILDSMFNQILEDFGKAIEQQIQKRVDKKVEEFRSKESKSNK